MLNLPAQFIKSARRCGYNIDLMKAKDATHLFIESDKILSSQKQKGLDLEAEKSGEDIKISLNIKEVLKRPIFLCFGILSPKGNQTILLDLILKEKAKAEIFTHCSFPLAEDIVHQMRARVRLEKGSRLFYEERHYHGEFFGSFVWPDFEVVVNKNAYLNHNFILNQGTVGKLRLDFRGELKENAFCEVLAKVVGRGGCDDININDRIILTGENSRSLIKMRAVPANGGKVLAKGKMTALASGCRGHIDCEEIVIGENSIAYALPIIEVKHPEAHITHEASVGKVNQRELESLMTRGLSEEEAIDFIISGKMK